MKKRILFVSEALWIGGIETALVNLLNRLDYEKYDVTCLIVRGSLELADRITPKCRLVVADRDRMFTFAEPYKYSRLYHLTEKSTNPSRLHKAMLWAVPTIKWAENRLYIRYIREHMKREHFDTCVIYSDRTAETAVRAVNADRFLMFYHHGAMRKEYHDEIGYRKSEKIITVSRKQEEKLRKFRPQYAEKMMTIHNLTDVEGIRAKAQVPIPEVFPTDKFNIVSCGRVSYEKGMDLAVEACAELVKMGIKNIHWWIIGGGPTENEVRTKIAELRMEDYVTMLGMKNNPYPYIKRADLYVQPSRFESYGLTIAEAMVLGKQIVSTDTDGAKELIRDGENGVLCTTDVQCIAGAVAEVMGSPNTEKDFSWEILENNRIVMTQLEKLL